MGEWHAPEETPVAQVYPYLDRPDDWLGEVYLFAGAYNVDIGLLRVHGSTFDGAVANLIKVMRQVGYTGSLGLEGREGEQYGIIFFGGPKPRIRMCWQVDWHGLITR